MSRRDGFTDQGLTASEVTKLAAAAVGESGRITGQMNAVSFLVLTAGLARPRTVAPTVVVTGYTGTNECTVRLSGASLNQLQFVVATANGVAVTQAIAVSWHVLD